LIRVRLTAEAAAGPDTLIRALVESAHVPLKEGHALPTGLGEFVLTKVMGNMPAVGPAAQAVGLHGVGASHARSRVGVMHP
jgi:hypothetical protein